MSRVSELLKDPHMKLCAHYTTYTMTLKRINIDSAALSTSQVTEAK
jgi:hypothetical protein